MRSTLNEADLGGDAPTPVLLRNRGPALFVRWAINFRGQRRLITRRCIFSAMSRVTPSVAVDSEGLRFYLSTADNGVSRAMFADGAYELATLRRVESELERNGYARLEGRGFLDIGANIGTTTCLALSKFGASRSYAFEPAPENVRLLRQNVLVNGLSDRVSVTACAVSDRAGSLRMDLSGENWGDHRVSGGDPRPAQPGDGVPERASVEVPAIRLDDLIADGTVDLASVGLAWIDVQGHEANVLDGGMTLVRSTIPIVCEYWPYGLRRAGSLERLHLLLARERATFVDLDDPDGSVRPTSDLASLSQRYRGTTYTNLLLFARSAA